MFGNDFIATLAQKLGFTPTQPTAPSTTPTPVNPKNEMVQPVKPAPIPAKISLAPIQKDSFLSTLATKLSPENINKATGMDQVPVPHITPSAPPTPEQIADAKKKTVDMLQAVPRGFYRLGASAGSAIASAFGKTAPAAITPSNDPVSRFFIGSEPIDTYQTEYKKAEETATKAGIPKALSMPLAVLSVAGESAGDILGFLPEGEARQILGGETKKMVVTLTEEKTAQGAYNTLREANISHTIADKYSEKFAAATTPKETTALLKDAAAEQIQKTTADAAQRLDQLKEKGKTEILTADEMNEQAFLKKNMNKPAELFSGYRTPESMGALKTENGVVPDHLAPESPETQALAEHTVERNDLGEVSKVTDSEGKTVYDANGIEKEPTFDGGETPATPEKISRYNNLRKNLSDRWTKVVENFQNNKNRIEKLVKSHEAKVTEESNPALAHTLYSGRLDTRMRAVQDELTQIVKTTMESSKNAGVSYQSFKDDVNDYLHSLHAPERNAKFGDGAAGITDDEAAKMQADLKAKPHFAQVKEVADKLLEMNKKTLDTLYQNGAQHAVIDKKTYDLLRDTYKNHVPLNRVFNETESISDALTGRGFDVRGSGLKTAKGSAREIADIYTNITSNLASAVQRVEKNLVDNATYNFVKENEEMGFGHVLKRAPTSTSDPRVLQLRVNGKDAYIKFEDQAVADQFKSVGNEHLPTMLRFIDTFTRFYSGLATRFNPEFVFSNKMRDLQEAMVYAASEGKLNSGSSVKILKREAQLQNERAILDHMRGVDSPGARAYQSMLDNGGATGGMALSTRGQVETTLEDIEKLAQSKPKQALNAVVNKIDQANEIFENSTRLSVYREGIAQGLSEKESAALAKESTVNFNKKGKFGSVINSLYMFSNASIQGSVKMIRAMRNPKVLAATAATVGSAVFITNKHNDSVDPNWRDKVSKFDRESNMVVVLQGGDQDFKYITIPVSYALKPFKVAFDGAYDLSSGAKGADPKNVLEGTVASVVNGYNPVGGTDLGSALTPTIEDVPREIGVNKSWTGSKIRPDSNSDLPDSRQYFDSLKDTPTGRAMIALTKTLSDKHIAEISPANMAYAISQYSGGAGQFSSKVFNTIENSVTGKATKPADIPFVSRFYKEVSGNELDTRQAQSGNDAAMIKGIRSQGAAATFDKGQYIKDTLSGIKALKTPEEKKAAISKVLTDHPEMMKDILAEVKSQNKSYSTKQLETLQIKNGERAKFIIQKMASLKTKKEQADFIDQLAGDNLLTPEVIQQISALKGQ